jgi:hypothetical protein
MLWGALEHYYKYYRFRHHVDEEESRPEAEETVRQGDDKPIQSGSDDAEG